MTIVCNTALDDANLGYACHLLVSSVADRVQPKVVLARVALEHFVPVNVGQVMVAFT